MAELHQLLGRLLHCPQEDANRLNLANIMLARLLSYKKVIMKLYAVMKKAILFNEETSLYLDFETYEFKVFNDRCMRQLTALKHIAERGKDYNNI